MTNLPQPTAPEDSVRPHVYDGIQEFNKRLPNWWLFTLYITMVFWVGYWSYYEWFRAGPDGPQRVGQELARIEAAKLAQMAATRLDDPTLWQMSRNPAFVNEGRAIFMANCVACHLASLRGKDDLPSALGPNLTDTKWLHGGKPMEILNTVTQGVPAKGMVTWGPVLGPRKITQVVAFVLSHHQEGEPVEVQESAPAAPSPVPPP